MTKFESLCNEYNENKRMIEELNALQDELKASIIELMNGSDTMTEGSHKATITTVNSTRLDSSALKKQAPDIYKAFSKVSSYKRFTVA